MAIKVDLLPTERKKFGFDIVFAILIVVIAAACLGFYMMGTSYEEKADALAKQVQVANDNLAKEKEGVKEIDSLQAKLRDIKAQIKLVGGLKTDPIRYSNLLDELAFLLPNNMWVSNIKIDPSAKTLVITGVAAAQPGVRPIETISGFMKNVGKSKYFTAANIDSAATKGSVSVGENEYVSYSYTITLTYNPDKAASDTPAKAEASLEPELKVRS